MPPLETPSLRIYYPWVSAFTADHYNDGTLIFACFIQGKTHPQTGKQYPSTLIVLGPLTARKDAAADALKRAAKHSEFKDILKKTQGELVLCGQLGCGMSYRGTSSLWTSWDLRSNTPQLACYSAPGSIDSIQVQV